MADIVHGMPRNKEWAEVSKLLVWYTGRQDKHHPAD